MPNVPNIVRERLKAAALPVDHPDANVLTAFAERSLPAAERGVVLDHIARCGECREILALALPPVEEVQLLAKPSRTAGSLGWLTWPTLRWGFVAAGVVLIGSLGVMEYHRSQPSSRITASNLPVHNEVAKNEALSPPPAPAATIPAEAPAERRDKPQSGTQTAHDSTGASSANSIAAELKDDLKMEPQRVAPVHIPQGTGAAGAIGGGVLRSGPAAVLNQQQQSQVPINGREFNQIVTLSKQQTAQQTATAAPAVAPVPTSTEMVEVQSENAQVNADKALDLPVQKGSVPDRASVNYSESAVGKAKLPVAAQTASAAPSPSALNPLPLQTQPSLMRSYTAPLPRWTITSSGGLQRSYDSGKTWQDVDVNANPASTADSLTLAVATNVAADKKAGKDSNARMKREAAMPLVFRVVTASGADVWAGGASSVLYHSLDAGLHWSRVTPASSSVVLTGDIVALEFSDTQHGKITTSIGETWITADDGQSWQKQ